MKTQEDTLQDKFTARDVTYDEEQLQTGTMITNQHYEFRTSLTFK